MWSLFSKSEERPHRSVDFQHELVENCEVSFDANALELLEEVKQAKEAFRQRSQLSTL